MVKSAVQVLIRTRPTSNFANDYIHIDNNINTIGIHVPKNKLLGVNNQQEDWTFKYNNILHNTSQENTYEVGASDIVDSVLNGYNGTIMAYGQTGAGKTYTMTGGTQNYKYRGLIPRSIAHIFREISDRSESSIIVKISYLEIYNETLIDLLSDRKNNEELVVMDNSEGQVSIRGLSKIIVNSEQEALDLLFEGDTNRQIAEHQMNSLSSRSHTIFSIHLEMRSRVESSEKVITSKLNLVDLAGSERVGKTGSAGAVLKEAQYINKSLSFLEQVVMALSDKNRQCKLTNVLRDSLGGNCKTRLIANIWAEKEQIDETISTLKFATRMMKVSTDAIVNVVLDPLLLVKKYERDIRELKQELAMHDALNNRAVINYEPYSVEQQFELQQSVRSFIKGDTDDIEVINLRHIKEVFKQFKIYCQNITHEANLRGPAVASETGNFSSTSASVIQNTTNLETTGSFVGDVDDALSGLALGSAASNARPPHGDPTSLRAMTADPNKQKRNSALDNPLGTVQEKSHIPDEATAFEDYKLNEGASLANILNDNQAELKNKKAELKSLSLQVNDAKKEIDDLTLKLSEKRSTKDSFELTSTENQDTLIIDEEEYALIRDLKAKKKLYQDAFHGRKLIENEVTYLKSLVSQTQNRMANEFFTWYKTRYNASSSIISNQSSEFKESIEDVLDDGEQFDKLERERIQNDDPESLSFYNARKNAFSKTANKKKNVSLRK